MKPASAGFLIAVNNPHSRDSANPVTQRFESGPVLISLSAVSEAPPKQKAKSSDAV